MSTRGGKKVVAEGKRKKVVAAISGEKEGSSCHIGKQKKVVAFRFSAECVAPQTSVFDGRPSKYKQLVSFWGKYFSTGWSVTHMSPLIR